MEEYWIQRWNNECRYRIAPRANYSLRNVGTRDVNIASGVMAREKSRECFSAVR